MIFKTLRKSQSCVNSLYKHTPHTLEHTFQLLVLGPEVDLPLIETLAVPVVHLALELTQILGVVVDQLYCSYQRPEPGRQYS